MDGMFIANPGAEDVILYVGMLCMIFVVIALAVSLVQGKR